MKTTVAVTGATGYVGKFVVPRLLEKGFFVRALARPDSDRKGFNERVVWVRGDMTTGAVGRKLVDGVDAVVHLAYSHLPGRYRGGEGADLGGWLNANLNASVQLLLAARNAGVKQFIFLSSRAVFSETEPGRVLDESHPTSPDTHYGAYKVAVEALLRSFGAVEGMRTTAIRATGIYGLTWPVEQSKWWNLVSACLAGEKINSNRGGTEVHGRDLAKTVCALLESPKQAPDLLHLSDLYVTHRQIAQLVQKASNRPVLLPPPPQSEPQNVLACPRLHLMGITLGGRALLTKTVGELVNACSTRHEIRSKP